MSADLEFRPDEGPSRVRVLEAHGAGNSHMDTRDFRPGEILNVVRWREDRALWWTSYDIDGAFAIPSENVEVIGRSYHWDPLPGSYTWNHGTEEEREFWTRAREEVRAAEAAEKRAHADLPLPSFSGLDRPEDYRDE